MSAREVARRVLDRVASDGAWATPALDGELDRAGLADRDRRLASELVYGVLRHRTRIDRALVEHADLRRTPPKVITALRVAAYQILLLDRVPGYAAVDDAVEAARAAHGDKLAGFANAVLRKLTANGEPVFVPLPADAAMDVQLARAEEEHSTPRWILDELVAASKDEVVAALGGASAKSGTGEVANARVARVVELAAAFARPAPLVARVNRLRATREAIAAEFTAAGITAEPVDAHPLDARPLAQRTSALEDVHSSTALRIDGLGDPSRDAGFTAGRWTVQDAGAQLVGHVAARAGGARILDACAGVGGKSTHLAELLDDRVPIDAADLSATKLALGQATATRLGLSSVRAHACDLLDPAAPLATDYDLIILDAPCSGLGVLRRHPDAKWRLVPADVPRLAQLQRMLLDAVVPRLAPGGTLIYSVCTFTRAEGPEQVAQLVARTGLELVEQHRTWPPDADAFYLARLTKPR